MKLNTDIVKGRVKNTLIEKLGIKFIDTPEADTAKAQMLVTEQHTQTMEVLHGGATITLAESIAGVASNVLCKDDECCFGMQISANHVSSAQVGDTVIAKATILHKGRTTHVWNVDITSQITGKLISSVRVTNAVVKEASRKM